MMTDPTLALALALVLLLMLLPDPNLFVCFEVVFSLYLICKLWRLQNAKSNE